MQPDYGGYGGGGTVVHTHGDHIPSPRLAVEEAGGEEPKTDIFKIFTEEDLPPFPSSCRP